MNDDDDEKNKYWFLESGKRKELAKKKKNSTTKKTFLNKTFLKHLKHFILDQQQQPKMFSGIWKKTIYLFDCNTIIIIIIITIEWSKNPKSQLPNIVFGPWNLSVTKKKKLSKWWLIFIFSFKSEIENDILLCFDIGLKKKKIKHFHQKWNFVHWDHFIHHHHHHWIMFFKMKKIDLFSCVCVCFEC